MRNLANPNYIVRICLQDLTWICGTNIGQFNTSTEHWKSLREKYTRYLLFEETVITIRSSRPSGRPFSKPWRGFTYISSLRYFLHQKRGSRRCDLFLDFRLWFTLFAEQLYHRRSLDPSCWIRIHRYCRVHLILFEEWNHDRHW